MIIDARAACTALELLPADLADLMRRDAARRLRLAAAALDDDDPPTSVDGYAQIDGMLANARDVLFRAAAFEALWAHDTPDDDSNDERAASVTEAYPHARPATPQSPVPPLSSQSSSVTQPDDVS